ncbi:uncharacterized protein LOC134798573 [Cydia splendana]|uniref:uncharacterized protein LOC134798573 n=1 Tax=Cydia splendana TaxID=1100963 RepID=UPI00300C3FB4
MDAVTEEMAQPSVPARAPALGRSARSSSSGSDSGGSSLLCAAPRWLAARRRRPRLARAAHTSRASHRLRPASQPDVTDNTGNKARSAAAAGPDAAGGWSVTVAGSCRAALPADVEMRLRFPRDARPPPPRAAPRPPRADADNTPRRSIATRSDETGTTECWCRCCSCGAGGANAAPRVPGAPNAPALPPPPSRRASLTFTMKKDDSSALNRKSRKKCSHTHLPQLEPAGDGQRRRSSKMRRACSLQCWLPAAPRRTGELAVEGSAIVPELKPRAPTMSERDLTRHHTPRLYLRC